MQKLLMQVCVSLQCEQIQSKGEKHSLLFDESNSEKLLSLYGELLSISACCKQKFLLSKVINKQDPFTQNSS